MDTSDDNNEGCVVSFKLSKGLRGDAGQLLGRAFRWLEAIREAE